MSWSISQPSRLPDVAMMRYAMPHTILSWTLDHEPERAALAFTLGMQLCLMVHGAEGTLADEPELGSLVASMAKLRHATAERTVMACFRDRLGLRSTPKTASRPLPTTAPPARPSSWGHRPKRPRAR